jgi:TolA-binding protein
MATATPPTRDVTTETQVFWLRFRKEIVAAIVILLLAGIGFAGYRVYSARRDAAAAESLASAKTAPDYQQVIARYPGTAASATAYLLLADSQRAAKRFAEANSTLETFISKYPDHELVSSARMSIAANLESLGKTDEALAVYQQVVTSFPKGFNAPLALISRVYLLKAKGRKDEALQTCEKLITEYRDSPLAREAMQEMRSLRPKETVTEMPLKLTPGKGPAAPPLLARPSAAPPKPAQSPAANAPPK